jgi:hypothetical protein
MAATTTVAVVAVFGVGAAQADPLAPAGCQLSALSQPFLSWGDSATYALFPGGDGSFAGWALTGGAAQVAGGYAGSPALVLPSGGVVTSPGGCTNIPHPTTRFFMRTDTPGAMLQVASIYDNGTETVAIPLGTVTPGADWAPSPPLRIKPVVVAALLGGTADVTVQFTATGGPVQIDDVYVDPYGRH